ncbi:patatin-like phospholipase family protein [uncultured Clostridium sp.]|jgi:NTE family protein|uniref:patatin-like phospholipase family protein n=1 Tax=uncultured Clostridium sp. TaxID=59620 RepID=UPI0026325257|nr:patatin-like phospholipase family protein [uncultured Clostridium sp.]
MKVGLVLSGGGGKGAYELGVWNALGELGLHKYIKVISGTSIGAFNAVLFAQEDESKAIGLWEEVTMDKLIPLTKFQLMRKGVALAVGSKAINFTKKHMKNRWDSVKSAPKDGVMHMIDKYLDIDKMKESGRICYAACTELPNFTPKYFKLNDYSTKDAKDIIMASATLPIIYKSTRVEEKKYFDGGIADNTPIQPVYGEGCDIIIVVLLSSDESVDRSLYPNTKIIEIGPKVDSEGMINGTLNLDADAKRKRIKHGYDDTIALLEPIFYMAKTSYLIDLEKKYPKIFKFVRFLNKFKRRNSNIN